MSKLRWKYGRTADTATASSTLRFSGNQSGQQGQRRLRRLLNRSRRAQAPVSKCCDISIAPSVGNVRHTDRIHATSALRRLIEATQQGVSNQRAYLGDLKNAVKERIQRWRRRAAIYSQTSGGITREHRGPVFRRFGSDRSERRPDHRDRERRSLCGGGTARVISGSQAE